MDAQVEMMQAIQAEYVAARQRLTQANAGVDPETGFESFTVYYDSDDDFLLFFMGEPQEAATLAMDETWLVRHDPETWVMVGMEMPNVAKFVERHPDAAAFILGLVERGRQTPREYCRILRPEANEMAGDVRELIYA